MYRKKKYRQKRKKRGRGVLLGSDWSKIYRNLQPYLQKRNKEEEICLVGLEINLLILIAGRVNLLGG